MDTDMQFYTRALCRELNAARDARTARQKQAHERLVAAYRLQLQRLAQVPLATAPELRVKPLRIAA